MTTIKRDGPPVGLPITSQDQTREVTRTAETKAPEAAQVKDGFGPAEAAAEHAPQAPSLASAAPAGGSLLGGLALIASLRQHPLFGAGARVKPLKPGETALEGELDPALLATDLAAFFDEELVTADEPKRAAIASLFGTYPGGRDALGPITDALT